jgi:hypothetical protein
MKKVLSLITFGIGALCFAMFVAVFKPNAVSAFPGQGSQPSYCNAEASPAHACRPHVFAAASRTRFGQR